MSEQSVHLVSISEGALLCTALCGALRIHQGRHLTSSLSLGAKANRETRKDTDPIGGEEKQVRREKNVFWEGPG